MTLDIDDVLPRVLPRGWHPDSAAFLPYGVVGRVYRHGSGLTVIVSVDKEPAGPQWLHVSCSYARRLPTWEDLKAVKRLFIGPERTAWQILAPDSEWVNLQDYTLHLWSRLDKESGTPLPPSNIHP